MSLTTQAPATPTPAFASSSSSSSSSSSDRVAPVPCGAGSAFPLPLPLPMLRLPILHGQFPGPITPPLPSPPSTAAPIDPKRAHHHHGHGRMAAAADSDTADIDGGDAAVEADEGDAWSWRSRVCMQQPTYSDPAAVRHTIDRLQALPPLVDSTEIDALRYQLAQCARGQRFLIQGGDCAERFDDCRLEAIECKLKIIMQMSLVLTWGASIPTCRVGRIAGQYGKPRSSDTEVVTVADPTRGPTATKQIELPCFRGDNVNGYEPTASARMHDPERLIHGHFYSACTLNFIRSLLRGPFSDPSEVRRWWVDAKLEDRSTHPLSSHITDHITHSIDFLDAIRNSSDTGSRSGSVDFFTSHEALILNYESSMTRRVAPTKKTRPTSASSPPSSGLYNLGAHFLWIGDRTSQLDGGHVEYCSRLNNPIGIKVGRSMTGERLVALIRRLDPHSIPGRLTLITRLGHTHVTTLLPPLILAVQKASLTHVLWCCDPMHGNTYATSSGMKTRDFAHILTELAFTFKCHRLHGSRLGGVHFEMTGEHVTECVGGPESLDEHSLSRHYATKCDPRLNYRQSMEMAFLLVKEVREATSTGPATATITSTPTTASSSASASPSPSPSSASSSSSSSTSSSSSSLISIPSVPVRSAL